MASTDYDLKKKFDFKNIEIKRFYSDIGMIMCEKTEIGQVFLNIIKNAAQAMNDFSLDKPTITLHTELINDSIRVTIEDNGPGIRDQDQKQIFEPFFTTKPVGEGTGLGLSVSYFIITSHYGGKIRVKSKQNKGTQFVIEFPKNSKNAAKRFIKS
jgi:signal transduction histidine kinase